MRQACRISAVNRRSTCGHCTVPISATKAKRIRPEKEHWRIHMHLLKKFTVTIAVVVALAFAGISFAAPEAPAAKGAAVSCCKESGKDCTGCKDCKDKSGTCCKDGKCSKGQCKECGKKCADC